MKNTGSRLKAQLPMVTHAVIFISRNRNGHEVGGSGGCVFHSAKRDKSRENWRMRFAGFQLQ
jgi:hypothetical protein